MLGKLRNLADRAFKKGESIFNRAVDVPTFKRTVYVAFLIASADDDFDADEKVNLIKLVQRNLPDFNSTDIIEAIRTCETKIEFDKVFGTQEILDEISKASSEPEQAKYLMNICEFIGKADGDYDEDEKAMAVQIAYALKLDPKHYGL